MSSGNTLALGGYGCAPGENLAGCLVKMVQLLVDMEVRQQDMNGSQVVAEHQVENASCLVEMVQVLVDMEVHRPDMNESQVLAGRLVEITGCLVEMVLVLVDTAVQQKNMAKHYAYKAQLQEVKMASYWVIMIVVLDKIVEAKQAYPVRAVDNPVRNKAYWAQI